MFNLHVLWILCSFSCCWFSALFLYNHIEYIVTFQFSCISWELLCSYYMIYFRESYMVCWDKCVFFQCLDEMFYRHPLSPFYLWCHLTLTFLCSFFLWGWPFYWWKWAIEVTHYNCVGGYSGTPYHIVFVLWSCVHRVCVYF